MVPAKDFALSKEFYVALGWQVMWSTDKLALLDLTDHRFYLQNHFVKDWANNFVLYVVVDDAPAWYEHALSVLAPGRFGSARVVPPKLQDYGALVAHVIDPSGVLIHFAQPNPPLELVERYANPLN